LRCRMRQLCTEALRSWYAAALSPHRRRTDPNTKPHTHANRSPTLTLILNLILTLALTLALSLSLTLTRYDAALLEQLHPLGRFSPEELALAGEGVTSGQEPEGLEHFCGDLSAGYTPSIGGGSAAAEAETGEAAAGAAGGIATRGGLAGAALAGPGHTIRPTLTLTLTLTPIRLTLTLTLALTLVS
jgi:hypothetical protein